MTMTSENRTRLMEGLLRECASEYVDSTRGDRLRFSMRIRDVLDAKTCNERVETMGTGIVANPIAVTGLRRTVLRLKNGGREIDLTAEIADGVLTLSMREHAFVTVGLMENVNGLTTFAIDVVDVDTGSVTARGGPMCVATLSMRQ